MKALLIFIAIIAFFALLLILPIKLKVLFDNEFHISVKYAGLKIFDTDKKKKNKKDNRNDGQKTQSDEKKENFFIMRCKEKGFANSVKYYFKILGIILKKALWIIKKLKFSHFRFNLTVCGDDAAKTAVEYGGICSVAYPFFAFLQTNTDFKSEKIYISTDFDSKNPQVSCSFVVIGRLIFLIIAAVTAIGEYFKLKKESEDNERK